MKATMADQPAAPAPYAFKDFVARLNLAKNPGKKQAPAGLRGAEVKVPSSATAVIQGSRNTALARVAGAARRLGADQESITAILDTANSTLCEPPLETAEVQRIAESVSRYEPRDVGAVLTSLTDTANAERLAYTYGQQIRYVPEWRKWIIWNGSRWQIDETDQVMEFAKDTARRIYEEAARLTNTEAQSSVATHARKSQQLERLRAMVKLASSISTLVVRAEDLDKDPMLLGVGNGVVDLRTGQLRPAALEDLMTMQCPVAFDASATCPVFTEFLERVTNRDPELLAYLARITGYSLTGSTAEQCLFFLHGSGANGKTTFLNVVKDILGSDYCKQTPSESLMVKKQGRTATNDLARLKGVRVTISNEVEEGSRMSESLIKQMTGSDAISARFLFAEFFDYLPQFKIWIAGNHQPVIRGTDDGIWRRLHLLPFTVTIPPNERDKELPTKLRAELPGILNWAIKGCLEWQKKGLQPPQKILDAVAEYKSEMDILGQWIEEECELGEGATIQSSLAFDNYRTWASRNGCQFLSGNAFGRRLKERFRKEHTRDGTFYHGLQFKTRSSVPPRV